MEIPAWKHDADAVKATLKENPNGSLITTTGCRIFIQESFRSKQLISMGKRIMIVGFMAIVVENNYCVSTTPSMMEITPSKTRLVEIDGMSFYEFTFEKNTTMVKSLDLVKDNQLLYSLFEEVLARGRVPFFYDYLSLSTFFSGMFKYTGSSLTDTVAVEEMIIAQLARSSKNRKIPLRNFIQVKEDIFRIPFTWIPLRNVVDGSSDTVAKIAGSYAADGLDSAIVNPTDKVQPIERILRT